MILRLWIIGLCLSTYTAHAQLNVEFLSNLDYEAILNDIWGYVDEDGTEYALVGMTTGLSVVSLADPTNPQEVHFIDGVSSIWRDIKTWGDFAYVTADQGQQGLLIVDLSPLPQDTPTYAFWRPDLPGLGFYNRSHNLWIDEYGLAYLAGSNTGGVMIVDVHTDPWNPIHLVNMPLDYAHDVYVRDSIAYTSEIYLGQLRSYDISDLENIQLLGFATTPYAFTHNAWLSDDGNSIFTTDERANAFIGSYDVSDPADIKELDRFRPAATIGLDVIPHNVHVWNDFVIISYYTDGCIILDASRPDNLIEVGNFDTYLEGHGDYNGSWGAYPFLPSGNILMSDRQHGLFVLGPNYMRGCFLEGSVTDAETHLPIQNAQIEILLQPEDTSEVLLPTSSDPQGLFKTGKAVPGTFMIRVSHPDYTTGFAAGMFENGVVLELNIELTRRPAYNVAGRVLDAASTSTGIPFAHVAVEGDGRLYQTQADEQGNYTLPQIIEGNYQLYAGNWGSYQISSLNVSGEVTQDILVNRGYYDDFLNDLGWTVTSDIPGANWERGEPNLELLFNTFQCNPDQDVADDFGSNAFVTGNTGGNAEDDDVENGFTMLSSPFMDLTDFNEPVLRFTPWICERFVEEQVYFVLVSNGIDTITINSISTFNFEGFWQDPIEVNLGNEIEITDQMQVHFLVQDLFKTDNVIKAALDKVEVFDADPTSTDDDIVSNELLQIRPNPVNDVFYIDYSSDGHQPDVVELYNVYGQRVLVKKLRNQILSVDLSDSVTPGMYIVQLRDGEAILGIAKIIVE